MIAHIVLEPNTQFASNWNFESNNPKVNMEKEKSSDPWQNADSFSFTHLSKNTTGSLDSLTDFGKEISSGTFPSFYF